MSSPKTAMHISDAMSAMWMSHLSSSSSEVSNSCESSLGVANHKESTISDKGAMMITPHGFTIESSPILPESSFTSQNCSTIIMRDTETSPIDPSHIETPNNNMEMILEAQSVLTIPRRPRSGSEGLDYLAFLAGQERQSLEIPSSRSKCIDSGDPKILQQQQQDEHLHHFIPFTTCGTVVVTPPTTIVNNPPTTTPSSSSSATSDTDDSEAMPPPQPRRPRSISNPDSMMSLPSYPSGTGCGVFGLSSTMKSSQQKLRPHFVLPPQLLREELAQARSAVVRKAAAEITMSSSSYEYNTRYGTDRFNTSSTIPEHAVFLQQSNYDHYDYINHANQCIKEEEDYDDDEDEPLPESGDEYGDDDDGEGEADMADALEDQHGTNVDESDATASISSIELLRRARSRLLEDLLSETNTMNLSNDRSITILPHTLSKYKMVYNQNGRVGIYTPQERAAIIARYHAKRAHRNWNKKIRYNCRKNLADRRLRVKGRFVKRTMEDDSQREGMSNELSSATNDQMPDVNDPDAGFCPTIEQPYRRLRRHTVT